MKRRTTVIALAAAALAAGCSNGGGSASRHYTLRSVSHCLRAQGAQVLDAQDPNYQDDPDAMAIGVIIGMQGEITGKVHGHAFTVDVLDNRAWASPGTSFLPDDGVNSITPIAPCVSSITPAGS
jgi:hypothetical protein